MNTNHARDESKKLVEALISLNSSEVDGIIDRYFEPNAAIESSVLHIQGTGQLKKISALTRIYKSSELVDEPRYDESKQTIHYAFKRTIKSPPVLPSLPIIGGRFTKDRMRLEAGVTLHLKIDNSSNAANQGQGEKLLVSRVVTVEPEHSPMQQLTLAIIRPILSLFVLFAATAVIFYDGHAQDSWFALAMAAISETYAAAWNIISSEKTKRQAEANQLWNTKGDDLWKLLDQAKSSATDFQATLEAHAKARGIPVDEYRKQAESMINDLGQRANGFQSSLEAQAKARGIPVEEYKRQAEELMNGLAQRVNHATHYFEEEVDSAKAQVKENTRGLAEQAKQKKGEVEQNANEVANQASQKTNEIKDSAKKSANVAQQQVEQKGVEVRDANETRNEGYERPLTPLGGHDPTAPGAPSFADAVKE